MADLDLATQAYTPGRDDETRIDPLIHADSVALKREAQARRAAERRRASGRRRLVDPITTERDYSEAELEFMRSMKLYQQASGRMFPTWSEVLEVLKGLGYAKVPAEPMKGE